MWRDERAKSISFFCKQKPVRVGPELIADLKRIGQSSGRNVRVCLHEGPDALFHEMVILENRGSYYRPHKHSGKGESFHIIEGSMAAFVFDEDGAIKDSCILEPGGCFLYKIGVNMYHAAVPMSDHVIYHESKLGPFTGEGDSIWADWAPDGRNADDVAAFQRKLLKSVG